MFDRTTGDNIAQEFLRIMGQNSFDSFKKEASEKKEASTEVDAVSFLVAPNETAEASSALDSEISNLEQYADDDCNHSEDKCPCEESDVSYLIDHKAQELLEGLGKIAASLRGKDEGFAADMVEATAISIKNDLVKEASKKLFVIDSLEKMASDLDNSGDVLASDMVTVTIDKIKKS